MYKEYPVIYNYETLLYGRKSRSDDPLLTLEEVLAKHNKILEDYARKHLNGPIPEENIYQEVASSETLDGRPEMLRLLKAIENPAIKAILVVEVQRLSRGDLEDAGRLIKILRYTNTLVITPTKTYDLRDEYDRDAFERELKRGNEYLEYFKKIQQRGKLESVKEGNYIQPQPPFGYDKIMVTEGNKTCPTLKINEAEAKVVRLIFNWYCNEDIGPQTICRRLEEMNIKTKKGLSTWSTYGLNHILQNIHYIGCVRWNFRKTVYVIEDQEVKATRPKAAVGEYLVFEGKHEPIISKELFEKAQEIRGNRHRTKPDVTLKNPLSGILYCKCGRKMRHNTYVRHGVEFSPPRIKCNGQIHCHTGSADYKEVMDYICDSIRQTIKDFEVRIEQREDDSVKLHASLIVNMKKKLKELEQKEVLQWEAQYDPDESKRLPQHVFQKLNEKLLAEKDALNKALCKAKNSMPKQIDYREKVMKFTDALEALKNPELSASVKNRYLKEIIERVEYDRPPLKQTAKMGHKGLLANREPFTLTIHLKL